MADGNDGGSVTVDLPDTPADTGGNDAGDTVVAVVTDDGNDNDTLIDHERRITELEARVRDVEARANEAQMDANDAQDTADAALDTATTTRDVVVDAITTTEVDVDGDGDADLTLPDVPAVTDTLDEIVPRRTPLFFRKAKEFRR